MMEVTPFFRLIYIFIYMLEYIYIYKHVLSENKIKRGKLRTVYSGDRVMQYCLNVKVKK